MKGLVPRIHTWVDLRARPHLRPCHIRPDRKTAWVSCRTHPSIPPDSHQPSCYSTPGFQISRPILGSSTSHFLEVRNDTGTRSHIIQAMFVPWCDSSEEAACCLGPVRGTYESVVQQVQKLGDTGLIASYPFIIWPKMDWIDWLGFQAMLRLSREELCGIGMV